MCAQSAPRWAAGDLVAGRYQVDAEIARNAHSIVLRVRPVGSDGCVILKMSNGTDPRFAHVIRAEGARWRSLRHPNLLEIVDTGECDDGRPFYTAKLINGETLEQRRARGPLKANAIIDVLRSAVAGLHVIHDAGFLHRDVKPANIIIPRRPDGDLAYNEAVLIDLGSHLPLANDLSDGAPAATLVGSIGGTVLYMAPEQFAGAPQTVATDVYALGAVLFEILFGHPLRSAAGIQYASRPGSLRPRLFSGPAVLECLTREPVIPDLPVTHVAFKSLVTDLLRRDAAARPKSMTEVDALLGKIREAITRDDRCGSVDPA